MDMEGKREREKEEVEEQQKKVKTAEKGVKELQQKEEKEVEEEEEEEEEEAEEEAKKPVKKGPVLRIIKLNEKQEAAVTAAVKGDNLFLTGSAGVGKSLTLGYIIEKLRGLGQRIGVTGSTGIAAIQIGGVTLNSFFSIHPEMVTKHRVRHNQAWTEIDVLIIDEISMLHPDLFKYLDQQAQQSRKSAHPFGDVQLIVVGDFFQLPPVHKGPKSEVDFVFELPLWQRIFTDGTVIQLTEVFRQEDRKFVSLLERIRRGNPSLMDSQLLSSLTHKSGTDYTKLFSRCRPVDEKNLHELRRLPGQPMNYQVSVSFQAAPNKREFTEAEQTKYQQQVMKNLPIGSTLALKKSAQVMMVANVCPEAGLANGSRGVVEGFCPDEKYPIVKFEKLRVKVRPYDWTVYLGTRGKAVISCIPLKLAYAITIHKSQGQSIDGLEVNLANVWECGQAYTSLSRAKSLEKLVVRNYTSACVKAHPKVLKYYSQLSE